MLRDSRAVLVVGGGFGGLAAAGALARAGHRVTLVERAAAWGAGPLGVTLSQAALEVLARMGLLDAVRARARAIVRVDVADDRGRPLSTLPFSRAPGEVPAAVAIVRDELHQELRSAVSTCEVLFSTTVAGLDVEADVARVELSSGVRRTFDVVIIADGARSRTAERCGLGVVTKPTGVTCWTFVVEGTGALTAPLEMIGGGARVGLIPLTAGRVYGYASARTERTDRTPPRATFSRFAEPARAVLERVDAVSQRLEIAHAAATRWTHGPVALLGDAAHLAPPDLGQGLALAFCDAESLAESLAIVPTVPEALKRYEATRRARASRVVWLSLRAHHAIHAERYVWGKMRDAGLRWLADAPRASQILERGLGAVNGARRSGGNGPP